MRSSAIFCLLAIAAPILAQEQYSIPPDSVDEGLRQTWCDTQEAQCPLICLQFDDVTDSEPNVNECDSEALTYQCVCSNNVSPNVTEYSQTLPFFICQEWGNQCVKACGQDNTCSTKCREEHPCGAQSPKRVNETATSTSSKSSPTQTGSSDDDETPATGFAGQTAAPGDGGEGAASSMLNLGQSYGLAVVFAGVFAGFALVL